MGTKEHVLRLHHHTVSGRRYLVLDGAEVFGSRGSTNVVSLEAAGHVLPFSLTAGASETPESGSSHANIGYVKILPHGSTGFSYHCFVVRCAWARWQARTLLQRVRGTRGRAGVCMTHEVRLWPVCGRVQDDARVMERGEALTSTRLPKPFVTITIPATEVHADAAGDPVSFYRMDVMSETRGTSMHKRFSCVLLTGTRPASCCSTPLCPRHCEGGMGVPRARSSRSLALALGAPQRLLPT